MKFTAINLLVMILLTGVHAGIKDRRNLRVKGESSTRHLSSKKTDPSESKEEKLSKEDSGKGKEGGAKGKDKDGEEKGKGGDKKGDDEDDDDDEKDMGGSADEDNEEKGKDKDGKGKDKDGKGKDKDGKGKAKGEPDSSSISDKAYALPDLDYPYDALEPYIDASTMKFHHDKHHATYVANINKATEGSPRVDILDLQSNAIEAGTAVRNNGGGHYNHAFFWDEMIDAKTAATTKLSSQLEEMINQSFGSFDAMKTAFEEKAAPGETFGSGWVWLCVTHDNELKIVNTPNQDNPLMKGALSEGIMYPILGLDVWEHAYYLKYQNLRPDYVSSWWNVVNWDKVSSNCAYVVENHSGVKVQG